MQGWYTLSSEPGEEWWRQFLYSSKTETRDHLPVMDSTNGKAAREVERAKLTLRPDIFVAGVIDANISEEHRKQWKTVTRQGEKLHKVDYRLEVTYHQTVMSYEFIIPRSGTARTKAAWEDNPIRCSAILEPDSVFKSNDNAPQDNDESQEDTPMDISSDEESTVRVRRPVGSYVTCGG